MHHAVELLKILRRSEDLKGVKYVLELLVPVLEPEKPKDREGEGSIERPFKGMEWDCGSHHTKYNSLD